MKRAADSVMDRWLKGTFGFALFLFPFSIFFFAFGKLPRTWGFSTSIVMALYAGVMLFWMMKRQPRQAVLRNFALVLLLALATELCGVRFGFPFGSYQYTGALGLAILGVPVAILLAWYSTCTSALGTAFQMSRTRARPLTVALGSALLVLALDLVLEPAAAFVKYYWIWRADQIPGINYLSWFSISFLIILLLQRPTLVAAPGRDLVPIFIFGMQWVLFALTDVIHGFTTPVLVSFFLAMGVMGFLRIQGKGPS